MMVGQSPGHVTPCSPESRLGLGCWAIGGHGWGEVDDTDSTAAISSALEKGVRLFDTADCYGLGHSEKILSSALGHHRHGVTISTKGGVRWNESGKVWKDNTPAYLRQALEASLERLCLDSIPLYFVHWPDGETPVAVVMEELEKMRARGLVQGVGLSNFSPEQVAEATRYGRVDVVQVKVNLLERGDFISLNKVCIKNHIRTMAFGCLAEGLLSGKFNGNTVFPETDHRAKRPSFQGKEWVRNLDFVAELAKIAAEAEAPVANVALQAVLDQAGVDYTLFGARNPAQVHQNTMQAALDLGPHQAAINDLVKKFGLPPLSWRTPA